MLYTDLFCNHGWEDGKVNLNHLFNAQEENRHGAPSLLDLVLSQQPGKSDDTSISVSFDSQRDLGFLFRRLLKLSFVAFHAFLALY